MIILTLLNSAIDKATDCEGFQYLKNDSFYVENQHSGGRESRIVTKKGKNEYKIL